MSNPKAPERIMAATLRQLGPCDPDIAAQRLIADLAGHGYTIEHRPPKPEPERCTEHPDTEPNALGHCPTCGPRGL